jgi:uncharacterized protein with HEPN domain
MPERDKYLPLRHMLDHTQEVIALTQGKIRSDLDSDRLLSLALVRLLEIVGEAANRVPDEVRSLHPEVPWPQIVSLRNRLIHGYDAVDNNILWQIIVQDLPALVVALEAILAQEDAE